jgi:hypothetical protein
LNYSRILSKRVAEKKAKIAALKASHHKCVSAFGNRFTRTDLHKQAHDGINLDLAPSALLLFVITHVVNPTRHTYVSHVYYVKNRMKYWMAWRDFCLPLFSESLASA